MNYDEEYIKIKQSVMESLGYDEEDMDDDSIEDEVNRETDIIFKDTFGFEY